LPSAENKESNLKKYGKIIFSFWILFHLACIITMPNSSSFLIRQLGQNLIAYSNVIGLHTSWNFFSPDPAHVMYFQYSIHRKDQSLEEESEELYIPPEKNRGPFATAKRRVMYSMRYMILDQRRVDALLGPWICHRHPEAETIHVEHKIESIPPIDEVVLDDQREGKNESRMIKMVDRDFNCQDLDEVAL